MLSFGAGCTVNKQLTVVDWGCRSHTGQRLQWESRWHQGHRGYWDHREHRGFHQRNRNETRLCMEIMLQRLNRQLQRFGPKGLRRADDQRSGLSEDRRIRD